MESTSGSSQNECGSVDETFPCLMCGQLKPLPQLETNCDLCLYEDFMICKSCHDEA